MRGIVLVIVVIAIGQTSSKVTQRWIRFSGSIFELLSTEERETCSTTFVFNIKVYIFPNKLSCTIIQLVFFLLLVFGSMIIIMGSNTTNNRIKNKVGNLGALRASQVAIR